MSSDFRLRIPDDISPLQRILFLGSLGSLIGLIVLGIAWEWLLAPLRPGGSWMVLKVLPLFAPFLFPRGAVLRADVYTLQWLSMLVLLYFTEGVMRAMSDKGLSAVLAGIEIALAVACFVCTISYLRPFKRRARERQKALEATEAAAANARTANATQPRDN